MNGITKNQWRLPTKVTLFFMVIAPLYGMSQTVIGMILAFQNTQDGGDQIRADLTEGVSIAMRDTSVGLGISAVLTIPFLIFLVLFLKKSKVIEKAAFNQTQSI